MSMKNSNNNIGNRTLPDLLGCSAMPRPTAAPRVYAVVAYNTLLFLRYFETYLGLSLSSNINITCTHKCVFILLSPGYSADIKTWKRAL